MQHADFTSTSPVPALGDSNNPNEGTNILNGRLNLSSPPEGVPPPTCERCETHNIEVYEWHSTRGDGATKLVFWCKAPMCGFRHWMEM